MPNTPSSQPNGSDLPKIDRRTGLKALLGLGVVATGVSSSQPAGAISPACRKKYAAQINSGMMSVAQAEAKCGEGKKKADPKPATPKKPKVKSKGKPKSKSSKTPKAETESTTKPAITIKEQKERQAYIEQALDEIAKQKPAVREGIRQEILNNIDILEDNNEEATWGDIVEHCANPENAPQCEFVLKAIMADLEAAKAKAKKQAGKKEAEKTGDKTKQENWVEEDGTGPKPEEPQPEERVDLPDGYAEEEESEILSTRTKLEIILGAIGMGAAFWGGKKYGSSNAETAINSVVDRANQMLDEVGVEDRIERHG